MATDIEADALTTFEVSTDGARVKFNAKSEDGQPVSLTLPNECIGQMLMTLPRMALEALRRRHGDDRLRIVYPIGDWRIEASGDDRNTFIVTLSTPDGYEVSFALSPSKMKELEHSMKETRGNRPVVSPLLN